MDLSSPVSFQSNIATAWFHEDTLGRIHASIDFGHGEARHKTFQPHERQWVYDYLIQFESRTEIQHRYVFGKY